jgi:hypothetical protein
MSEPTCGDKLAEDDFAGEPFVVFCEKPAGHDGDHEADRFGWSEHGFREQHDRDEFNAFCFEVIGKTADELIWEEDMGHGE